MTEAEVNQLLTELAAQRVSARMNLQDYRRQRRAILARFSGEENVRNDETFEWQDVPNSIDETAELHSPSDSEITAELNMPRTAHTFTLVGLVAAALVILVYLLWRAL